MYVWCGLGQPSSGAPTLSKVFRNVGRSGPGLAAIRSVATPAIRSVRPGDHIQQRVGEILC